MNRYPLNARTLGRGISVPQTYWDAAVSIVVVGTQAVFTQYRAVALQSSITLYVNTTTVLIRAAGFAADAIIQMSPIATATRVQQLVSNTVLAVNTSVKYVVGVARWMASNVIFGVQGSVKATTKAYLFIAQVISGSAISVFGAVQKMTVSQAINVLSRAEFTSFGDYAPSERYIIVDSEDRDLEVN